MENRDERSNYNSNITSQAKARLACYFFLDLDGFKALNDGYRHEVGNEILRTAAKRLLSCVWNFDYLATSTVVLNIYRGGWCPYCNMEMKALHGV